MPEETTYSEREFQICFLENSLELDILARNTDSLFDQLTLLPYYEEDDSKPEGDKKDASKAQSGILSKIAAGIRAIIDKIQLILEGAMRAFSNIGKDHMTYDKYKNSEKGKAELDAKIAKIKKEIDDTFLEARPVVKWISNVFHMDPDKVRNGCDKVMGKICDANWKEGGKLIWNLGHEHLAAAKGYRKTLWGANSRLRDATNALDTANMDAAEKKDRMSALNATAKMLSSLSNAVFGGASKAEK